MGRPRVYYLETAAAEAAAEDAGERRLDGDGTDDIGAYEDLEAQQDGGPIACRYARYC